MTRLVTLLRDDGDAVVATVTHDKGGDWATVEWSDLEVGSGRAFVPAEVAVVLHQQGRNLDGLRDQNERLAAHYAAHVAEGCADCATLRKKVDQLHVAFEVVRLVAGPVFEEEP